MGILTERRDDGIVVVTMDYPPVNALPVQGWFDLADALTDAGRDQRTRVVILNAKAKGFNAGVDIKELSEDRTHKALVDVNTGCYQAFKAVYECPVPVIAVVQGFCVGGGIGLAGNADVVIASEGARFGLPEVDRGALGAATHLARLVPQHLMRAMVYTSMNIPAEQLLHYGSVYRVVPADQLMDAALELAANIAAKHPRIIRAAKASLNGIDPVDVNRSYRFEQGFTMELNLSGVSDEARDAFVDKREAKWDNDKSATESEGQQQ